MSATPVAATMRSRASRASSGVVAPRRGLDQLARRPDGHEQLRRVVARLLGCGRRLRIPAETVEENRVRPVRVLDRGPLTSGRGLLDRGVDQPRGLRLPPPKAGEHERAVGRDLGARGLRDAIGLRDQHRDPVEVPAQRGGLTQDVDAHREHGQRARVARELDPAIGDRKACLVVPHHHRRRGREPPPAEHLLGRDIVARKPGRGPLENRSSLRATVRECQGEAVQQQVGRARTGGGPGGRSRLARDVVKARAAGELPGEERRAPGIEIGLARELHVERVERLRGAQEQARGFAPAALGVRGLSAQQVQAGVLESFELTGLGCGEQPTCHVERPRRQAGLGGGERPVGAPLGIAGQRDRTLQERGRCGQRRRAPEPGPPTAQARARPPRRARPPPQRGARPGDRDRRLPSVTSASARCAPRRSGPLGGPVHR